jgi:hypothetical protein
MIDLSWGDAGVIATVLFAIWLAWWVIRDSNKVLTPREIERLEQQNRERARQFLGSGRTNRTGTPINRRNGTRGTAA